MAQDILLAYCIALDAGNFDLLGEILKQAQGEPGLEASILGLHARFDTNESWTAQLQAYREQLQEEKARKNPHGTF